MEARLVDSDQPGRAARRESRVIRSVNSSLRERSEAFDSSERIAFFCECQNVGCYLPMWMSVNAFDTMVAAEAGWLLLDGHQPSALWHHSEPLPTRESARSRRAQPSITVEDPQPTGSLPGQERPRTPGQRLSAFSAFLPVRQGALNRAGSIKP